MTDDSTPVAGTEPMTLEQMAEALVEPEAEEESSHDETADAPDTEEDQPEVEEAADDAEAGEDEPEEVENEEDEEEDDSPETPLFTVKVDGKDEQVTLEDLQRGYSGQKYVQRGMQENAEARKQINEQAQIAAQQLQQLDHLIQGAQSGAFIQPTPPDPAMLHADPIGYMEAKAAYDQQAAEYQNTVNAYNQQVQWQQQQQEAQQQSYLAEQRDLLVQAIPEFGDQEKAPALTQKLTTTAMSHYGFGQDELQALADSRQARVLYDAMRYHELVSKQTKAVKKVSKAPPVAKAGAKTDQRRSKARQQRDRLRKSGSDADAMGMMFLDD